jgi:putative nucleotidyltransferase with HDIG domain
MNLSFKPDPKRLARNIACIFVASLLCTFALWYQSIMPTAFNLGQKSPVTLLSKQAHTVLDIEATEEEKHFARIEALNSFLSNPTIIRDSTANALSISNIEIFIQSVDHYYELVNQFQDIALLSKTNFGYLLLTDDASIDELFKGDVKKIKDNPLLKPSIDEIEKKGLVLKDLESVLKRVRKKLYIKPSSSDSFRETMVEAGLYKESSLADWLFIKPFLIPLSKEILDYGYMGYIDETTINKALSKHINFSKDQFTILEKILKNNLRPNLVFDSQSINELEEKKLLEVQPVWKSIPAQTVIVRKGELLTKNKIATIEQLSLNQRKIDWPLFREAFWMTFLVSIAFYLFVRLEKFQLSFRQMLLLSSVFVGASAFIGIVGYKEPATIPLAAVAMITCLFFKPSVGLSAGILFGILCIQALKINPLTLVPSFIGVIVGTVLAQKAQNRADLAYAGVWLAISQMLGFIFVGLISHDIPLSWYNLFIQGFSGLMTAFLVSSGMPYLESLFGVVTSFRLLELSDPNQPLLKRLHDEAPGTYEHTLVVADLAQNAAMKIGADDELVRVGILYHDVGKLYRPTMFIENQFGGENPHDTLSPLESAKAIVAHVPEGIELAKKYKIPEPLIQFIPAHQGTARAGHFFLKAAQMDHGLKSDIDFRYPGPKPTSKETAIAMLADTVEATIRSMKTGDKELVKETINNLIQARISDNQLTESTLTTEELTQIANSFYESWKNKNHERLKYITDLKK